MFTLWLDFFFLFFFLLLPNFYPLLLFPLNQSSHSSLLPVASFNSSTCRQPKPLPSADNADWSLLSHFSCTLSLNLSPSQTSRPMIANAEFWFCRHDWQNNVVAVTRFYVDGFYFYFDEWVLILLMVDEWGLLIVDEWWLGFFGFVVAFG